MERILKLAVQIVIITFIIFFVGIVYLNNSNVKTTNVQNNPISPTPDTLITPNSSVNPVNPTIVDLFSQVSQHNNSGDCWMIISGHIYNITSYFGSHPGGDGELAKYCGQDATSGFVKHSAVAVSMLQQFLIQ